MSTSLQRQGISVSPATVRHQLNEQGLTKLQLLHKPLLSDTLRLNQLKWAKSHQKKDWSKIIFTDETTFSHFGKSKTVWRQRGEIIKVPTVKYSAQIHVWGCFSEKRFGNIYCFTNTLNADLLCEIYKS